MACGGRAWMVWSLSREPQKSVVASVAKPGRLASSSSSASFMARTCVLPTKVMTRYASCSLIVLARMLQMPRTPAHRPCFTSLGVQPAAVCPLAKGGRGGRALELDAGLLVEADAVAHEAQRAVAAHVAACHDVALADLVEIHHLKVHNGAQIRELRRHLRTHCTSEASGSTTHNGQEALCSGAPPSRACGAPAAASAQVNDNTAAARAWM